jgi:hypothetical protein
MYCTFRIGQMYWANALYVFLIRFLYAPTSKMKMVRPQVLKWSPGTHEGTMLSQCTAHSLSLHFVWLRSLLSSPQLAGHWPLQEYFPQFTLQGCSLWLQRININGPSAEKLGGVLQNQYWLLQEAALPKANWKPFEHFQNFGYNHLSCWLPCPNMHLQSITSKSLLHVHSYQREVNDIFLSLLYNSSI